MMQVYDVFHDKQAETDFVGACVFFLGFRLIEAHPDAALFLSRDGVSLIIYRTVDAVLILAERKGDLTSGLCVAAGIHDVIVYRLLDLHGVKNSETVLLNR